MPRFTIEQARRKLDTTFPRPPAAVKLLRTGDAERADRPEENPPVQLRCLELLAGAHDGGPARTTECLAWLADVGWQHHYGPDIAPDGDAPERDNYRQVLLLGRLRSAQSNAEPDRPAAAWTPSARCWTWALPVLLAANSPLSPAAGGRRAGAVPAGRRIARRLYCVWWIGPDPSRSKRRLAVNQFSVTGPHHAPARHRACSSTACRWC